MSVDLDELEARVRGREDTVIHLWGSEVLALIERAKQAEEQRDELDAELEGCMQTLREGRPLAGWRT